MLKNKFKFAALTGLLISSLVVSDSLGADASKESLKEQEVKMIALLSSKDATLKDKADACRILGQIGSKDAIAPLTALLSDEQLSHMARYGLEPINDSAVDKALLDSLSKLEGRPLVGVIGSIGVRRDAGAADALIELLKDENSEVAQAAARSLGSIGTEKAAKGLDVALENVSVENSLAFCEGALRCAENLAEAGKDKAALNLYDRITQTNSKLGKNAHHQVHAAALRGTILTQKDKGIPLMMEAISGDDFVLVAAAARTAQEMSSKKVIEALSSDLGKLPVNNQIVVIQSLGKSANPAALPALSNAAKQGPKAVRIAAIRALPELGKDAQSALQELEKDSDEEIAKAAQASMAAMFE